jgi:hypothetical protein
MIEGWVFQYNSYNGVPSIPVYINNGYGEFGPLTTDSNGYFKYSSIYNIQPYSWYSVEVNGKLSDLTHNPVIAQWGQCRGLVETNGKGYASITLFLDTSTVVNVTYAALYSNTQFATLSYGLSSSSDFYHTLSFGILNSGINLGYSTSLSGSFLASVTGVESIAVQRMYYASAFCDYSVSGPGAVTVGITGLVPDRGFYQPPISEYIANPSGLLTTDQPHTFSFGLGPSTETYYYSETSSYTWGASGGSPFGIIFSEWGNIITLDETVTTTTGSTNDVTISVTVPRGYGMVDFMAYCPGKPGTSFSPLAANSVGSGGFELHIWDISGDG